MPDNTLQIAAQHLRAGRLVAFPTETVYGLGANALDPLAVAKIFELKERPSFDPLIVHIADLAQLTDLVAQVDERVYRLAERFWPGPLTMVLPKTALVPDLVSSGLPTVGIRMPNHPLALALIREAGCPLAAPSANKFGRISPTTAAHVRKQLPGLDYLLDGGPTQVGLESTIIRLTDKGFQILRNGAITREDLETILPLDTVSPLEAFAAPGMLKSHYSPRKPFLIAEAEALSQVNKAQAGLISFTGELEEGFAQVIRVSTTGELKDYAAKLFEAMNRLEDEPSIEAILAEAVPEQGIGLAIMDRLRKAEYAWRQSL